MAQRVKNLTAMQETQVRFLDWEDILEKGMAAHSSNSCLENSKDRGAWQATVRGVAKSRTLLRLSHTHIHTVLEAGSLKSVSLD